ncbi:MULTISPECIES: hypothetical protein [Nocardiopsis]|uniref:Secreted protein n=1 Tax=Nocardiopsis sinuspersici TaxID=501010 RepID=A0A1V3C2B2_9ACTN|nr:MULTISPECIES: hypothetical protein [Nocardiopsis]OOC54778.1 hypothetical protein NOSIN_13970 [Nocardiopsis sinuspersici]
MRTLAAGTAAGLAAAVLALTPAPAAADHERNPTVRELLERCGEGTDVCEFHPSGQPEYFQNASEPVGSPVYNCTDHEQLSMVQWSETTGESNSVNLSMTATFGAVFKQSFSVSYGHEWSSSHTQSQRTQVVAQPGEVARVYYGPRMQRVHGTYELHFPDREWGHYVWYAPFTAEGPAEDQGSTVTQSTRPMTDEERSVYCG